MKRAFLCRAAAALCIPALLLSLAPPAARARGFTYGPRLGFIVANITETPPEWDDAREYRAGFTAGVFLDYRISETIAIQPEILYTRKGVKTKLYDSTWLTLNMDVAFDYIELPILIKYFFRPGEHFSPWLYAGPSFAYCLGSEIEFSAWRFFSASVDFSSLSHATDFGMLIGAGFSYPLGYGALTFDARFQRMFTNAIISGDFEIDGSRQTISGDDFKHFGFVVMAGYAF